MSTEEQKKVSIVNKSVTPTPPPTLEQSHTWDWHKVQKQQGFQQKQEGEKEELQEEPPQENIIPWSSIAAGGLAIVSAAGAYIFYRKLKNNE